MKVRVSKRRGFWKIYFVYYKDTPNEYEVYLTKFTSFKEAYFAAYNISIAGA